MADSRGYIPDGIPTRLKDISFSGYCDEHLKADYRSELQEGLNDRTIPVGKTGRRISDADMMEVTGIAMKSRKFYLVNWKYPVRIRVCTVFSANIRMTESIGDSVYQDTVSQWYQAECDAILCDGNATFFPTGSISIYDKYADSGLLSLDSRLIPVIHHGSLDEVAATILEDHYPDALLRPCPVDAKAIAADMGAGLKDARLSVDAPLIGRICFYGNQAEVYDENSRRMNIPIEAPVILIDYDAAHRFASGKTKPHIIHECVHLRIHRPFLELLKLYDADMGSFSCRAHTDERDILHKIEKQASQLAPRILMPLEQTKKKADELIASLSSRYPKIGRLKVMEKAIPLLAEFYGVSIECARIRMLELGYNEARGVQEYENGKRIPAYEESPSAQALAERCRSYSIGLKEACEEMARNEGFRNAIESGQYAYLENHFCLKDDKYIRSVGADTYSLTSYARHHIDECCLCFEITSTRPDYLYGNGILENRRLKTYYKKYVEKCRKAESGTHESYAERSKKAKDILQTLPAEFGPTLSRHMDRVGVTKDDLCDILQVSSRTIQRLRTDSVQRIKKETVLCLGLAMLLYPELIDDMLMKSGNVLTMNNPDAVYRAVVSCNYDKGLAFCNKTLVQEGISPLNSVMEY